MSFTAIRAAMLSIKACPDLSMPAKLVLLKLADSHNQETGRCDPSVGRISADLGISERSVRNGLRDLEAAGLLKTIHRVERTGRGRKNLNNRYKIAQNFHHNRWGGAQFAAGVGHGLPTKQEASAGAASADKSTHATPASDSLRPSAFDDLAMLIEDEDGGAL